MSDARASCWETIYALSASEPELRPELLVKLFLQRAELGGDWRALLGELLSSDGEGLGRALLELKDEFTWHAGRCAWVGKLFRNNRPLLQAFLRSADYEYLLAVERERVKAEADSAWRGAGR